MNVQISPSADVERIRRPSHARFEAVADERVQLEWYIRYTFYGFLFSLPFEMADVSVGGLLTLSKLLGYLFFVLAFFQRSICFKRPPKALWVFGIYMVIILGISGLTVAYGYPDDWGLPDLILERYRSRIQMLVMAWLSYNVLRQETVVKGALLSLSVATILLVLFQFAGLAGDTVAAHERATAFDANPNSIATVVAMGIISVFGLAYGRAKSTWKDWLLFWSTSALLATSLVRTGSRGALLALMLSFSLLCFKKGAIATKLKLAVLAFVACVFLAVASYQIPEVRERWEQTLEEGNTSGRDKIFASAIEMFLEKPMFGWGFVNNFYELGARVGMPSRDPHNLYLLPLTEVGLIGTIPFLAGLWLCWRSAWKARLSVQGVTPLMMLTFLLISGLKGSWFNNKLFWFVIAYALASGTHAAVKKRWPSTALAGILRQRKPARVSAKSHAPG